MAEQHLYLPGIGFCVLFGYGVERLSRLLPVPLGRGPLEAKATALLAGIVLLFSLMVVERNRVWADPVTLWRDSIAKVPTFWGSHYALATEYKDRGDFEEAKRLLRRTIELNEVYYDAYINLGICEAELGNPDEAEKVWYDGLDVVMRLEQAQPGRPDVPRARSKFLNNLGRLKLDRGETESAAGFFERVIAQEPRNCVARRGMAEVALHSRDLRGAVEHLYQCLNGGMLPDEPAYNDMLKWYEALRKELVRQGDAGTAAAN
jgi:tetratricopeptide (TPR) repeat protein